MASRRLVEMQQTFARRMAPPVSGQGRFNVRLTLYHYTGAASFHNIVTSGAMWATNLSFLNDPSEMNYGLSLLRDHLTLHATREHGPRRIFLDAVLNKLRRDSLPEVYVCCFTALKDNLSQWRAYGNAATARYSIGFDGEGLRDRAAACEGAVLGRVIYERSMQVERLAHMTQNALQFIVDEAVDVAEIDAFATTAASHYAAVLPLLKSEAFTVEDEWRVIITVLGDDDDRLNFDTSRGTIKPYIPFALSASDAPSPIQSVHVLAPARPDAAIKAATLVLARARIDTVRPVYSEVPFAE